MSFMAATTDICGGAVIAGCDMWSATIMVCSNFRYSRIVAARGHARVGPIGPSPAGLRPREPGLLNGAGGILADLTIMRLAHDRVRVVTGGASRRSMAAPSSMDEAVARSRRVPALVHPSAGTC
jgi:hypothetical protein